jgi:hypothetical protein
LHVQAAGTLLGLVQNTASSADARLRVQNTAGSADFGVDGTGTYFQDNSSRPMSWYVSGSEQMRLTSTGLGIGTSSPGYKLTVAGASGSAVVNLLETGVRSWGLRAGGTATNTFDIADFTAGATRLTIDSSGNLGLGVTPSAWGTTKALEFSYGSFSANASLGTDVAGNCYYNGTNWIYRATGVALRYYQATAGHSWYVASGTAGNNISFGDAKMTLDASGNLGVGTTTPASGVRLHVDASGGGTIRVTRLASSATAYGQLENDGTDSTLTSTGALIFQTGSSPAPRARITSGGVFLVGTATAGYGLFSTQRVTINPNQDGIVVAPLSENFSAYTVQGNNDTGTRYAMYIANGSSTAVGNISFTSSATAYNTSSDRRLKENVDQSDDAGSLIDAIEVVKHDWKVGGHVRYGVIAQDLHDVVPEAVTVGDSEDVEALKNPWGVDYSKLVPMLVKEIQSLRARVAQLESK